MPVEFRRLLLCLRPAWCLSSVACLVWEDLTVLVNLLERRKSLGGYPPTDAVVVLIFLTDL